MVQKSVLTAVIVLCFSLEGCSDGDPDPGNGSGTPIFNSGGKEWLIPFDEVLSGGPGKDGIPALVDPEKIDLNDQGNDYLHDDDLIIGYRSGGEIVGYPHPILDWHEIINDRVGESSVAINYCPLTGTGLGWDRMILEQETTFGVSGLLYNTNLIPYDRLTGSNWTQIGLQCVNGELIGKLPETHPVIEMNWKDWKMLYPHSTLVSTATGHSRSYGRYPYGNYKTSNDLIFPANPEDDRLHKKERVLAIIVNGKAKVYRFGSFSENLQVIHDQFMGESIVVAGIKDHYMVAYSAKTNEGPVLDLQPGSSPALMTDREGNQWDLFGVAVSGPKEGQSLQAVTAMMAYWFSIAAFYPEPLIY